MRRSLLSRVMLASVLAVLVVVGGLATARWLADDGGWSITENRVWIERMPRTPRDLTQKLCFIHDDGERMGVFVHSSEFRMFLDTFFWFRRDDGRVRIVFPQDQKERMPAVRAWKCEGEAPAPFELCLEMREGDQLRTYYSREDWVIGDVSAALAGDAEWNTPLSTDSATAAPNE